MKKYLKYKGNMLPYVIDFVGQENIISEPHPNVGVIGYFLTDNNISDRRMFCDRMYIIKDLDTGNISLDYRKPENGFSTINEEDDTGQWFLTSISGGFLSNIQEGVPVCSPEIKDALAFETVKELDHFIDRHPYILSEDSFKQCFTIPK